MKKSLTATAICLLLLNSCIQIPTQIKELRKPPSSIEAEQFRVEHTPEMENVWTVIDEANRQKAWAKKEAEEERAWKREMLRLSMLPDAISAENILLGMTKEQARAKFGHPNDINRSVGHWGVHEQWVYKNMMAEPGDVCYLYFENGILTSWQN